MTGPPGPAGAAGAVPLRVAGAARRVYGGRSNTVPDPELRRFVEDLVRPYGNALRDDLIADGSGHAYAVMAEDLMAELVTPARPVDLIVLASAVHDNQMARPSATYLSHVCPGSPMAFAVSDQGVAGAHTALRLVRDQVATGPDWRALLVLAEQPTLHYEPTVVDGPAHLMPRRPAAVALLCEAGGTAELVSARQYGMVEPDAVAGLLAAAVADTSPPHRREDVTLVLGAGLAAVVGEAADRLAGPLAGRVLPAPAGQPFTGVWWELAAAMAAGPDHPAGGGLMLLADYEPQLRYLCVSAIHLDHSLAHQVDLPRQVCHPRAAL